MTSVTIGGQQYEDPKVLDFGDGRKYSKADGSAFTQTEVDRFLDDVAFHVRNNQALARNEAIATLYEHAFGNGAPPEQVARAQSNLTPSVPAPSAAEREAFRDAGWGEL